MKYERIAGELSAYLDGEVTPTVRVEIEAHLGGCKACQQRLAELRKLSIGVAAQPQAQPSPRFLAEVRAKISGAGPAVDKPRWFDIVSRPVWLKVPLEAVAVVVLLLAAGVLLLPSRPQTAERISGALAKKAEQRTPKEVAVTELRNEPEHAPAKTAPSVPAMTATPIDDRSRLAFADEKPRSSVAAGAVRGFSGQVQQVAKSGGEVESQTATRAIQQATATMEITAVSVADVRQRAETLATALGGRLLVAVGDAWEKSAESKAFAAPVVLVELPTSQVAAFKERLLAETAGKNKLQAMDNPSLGTTSTVGYSGALGLTPPRAPRPQQTQEETTARTVLDIRVVLPAEAR